MLEYFKDLSSIGYFLITFSFVIGGIRNVFNWDNNITFLKNKGVPLPEGVLTLGIITQLTGGVLVLWPDMRRYGLWMLLTFTVVMMLIFFRFWEKEGLERHVNALLFLDNIALLGGLLLALSLQ